MIEMGKKDNKKDKSIIIYNQPHKGLSVHSKRHVLKIGLSNDEEDKKEYYLNRIKELETANQNLKDAYNSLTGRREELKYLKEFRDIFLMHCMKSNIRKTILQCTSTILLDGCSMKDTCKPRIEILKRIQI